MKNIQTEEFIEKAKKMIYGYYLGEVPIENIHLVWYCKTCQNMKAILMAQAPDNIIFECTLNGDVGEIYLDIYDKKSKIMAYI